MIVKVNLTNGTSETLVCDEVFQVSDIIRVMKNKEAIRAFNKVHVVSVEKVG